MSHRPYFEVQADQTITQTYGENPQAMSLDEARAKADQIERDAHSDYGHGFCVGAEYAMDHRDDLLDAIRVLEYVNSAGLNRIT